MKVFLLSYPARVFPYPAWMITLPRLGNCLTLPGLQPYPAWIWLLHHKYTAMCIRHLIPFKVVFEKWGKRLEKGLFNCVL